jgi:antitoxin component YwqK of YwqJK toxin-antitoxin module
MKTNILAFFVLAFALSSRVAAETITYAYDAKGRLVRVTVRNGANNGVVTAYDHDKADNRKVVRTTGAPR